MRWGVELWDRFDDVSNYVHKGIEFCERYEEFCKKRCTIENNYAKHLRKLIESFEPKKKDNEENNTTHLKCFVKMLNELKDIAGQHELVAENIEDRIIIRLNQMTKSLKEERRKCIDDKERYSSEHIYSEEQLEKSKQKYERAFKELEKAKDLYFKIDNDDHSSKSDIKKQKLVCDQKQSNLNTCEAEYGKQLCEANKTKSLYYREQMPAVLDTLQNLEEKRINNFKGYICDCVNLEVEVMPRISRCHKEIENAALVIDPEKDSEIPVALYKTGYSIPNDYVFEDLNDKNSYSNLNNNLNQSTNGSINSSIQNGTFNFSINNAGHTTRQKKYRTISRLKGIFLLSGGKPENDLYSLPPQQLKKELLKKIDSLQAEIIKQQKEREGIIKLKDIYSKNQKLGDAQATTQALEMNEEKLQNLTNQLRNYQDIYNEVEVNGNYNLKQSNNHQQQQQQQMQQQQQHSSSSNEYSSSSTSTISGNGNSHKITNGNGTLPRENLTTTLHIYQSPSQTSVNNSNSNSHNNNSNVNSSVPGTPNSHHSTETPAKKNNISNNSAGAYAVSPVSQMLTTNTNNKMAPIVGTNNNESFDDDDDDDENYDDGCYENPSAALKAVNLKYQSQTNMILSSGSKALTDSSTTATTKSDSFKSNGKNDKNSFSHPASSLADSTAGIIYADSQYDHVDSINMYDAQQNQQDDNEYDKDLIIGTALVMYAFEGSVQNAMSIQENESLNVLEKDKGDGWTLVKRLNGEKGYVPTDYIRIVYY